MAFSCAGVVLGCVLTGCTTAVATDLDESNANRVAAALDESGVATQKVPDPNAEGRWRIDVGKDDATRAASVLAEQDLPGKKTDGILDSLGTNALVPSRASEETRILVGTSGELERTLGGVDGVLSARVHLATPHADPLSDKQPAPPTASVLIRYRGDRTPISNEDVQRLVAGAVPDLAADHVTVVAIAAPKSPAAPDLVLFGPFSTTRDGASKLRGVLAAAALLNVILVAWVAALWTRARSLRRKPFAEAQPGRELR